MFRSTAILLDMLGTLRVGASMQQPACNLVPPRLMEGYVFTNAVPPCQHQAKAAVDTSGHRRRITTRATQHFFGSILSAVSYYMVIIPVPSFCTKQLYRCTATRSERQESRTCVSSNKVWWLRELSSLFTSEHVISFCTSEAT